jgi:hypothetical protein
VRCIGCLDVRSEIENGGTPGKFITCHLAKGEGNDEVDKLGEPIRATVIIFKNKTIG